jgi:glycosyltransferase involved in cell wall biosynthesis
MSALDVVALPSALPEPFGGVVIEAMALGRPVVGTNAGGTPEQIDDGVTGHLVPPGDPPALAEAIGRLLADRELRERMGAAGRSRYLERFEFERFYGTMTAVYQELIAQRQLRT